MPTRPRVERGSVEVGGGNFEEVGCRGRQRASDGHDSGSVASTTRRVSRHRHGAGIHHDRALRGGEAAGVHRDGEVGGRAQGAHEQAHRQGAEVRGRPCAGGATRPRARGSAGRGQLGQIAPNECTRCSAAAVATTGRSGRRRRCARWSPRRVGVDPRDQHGRGQHDDEHPQRHREGGVEVAAGEEPRRPADRERGHEPGEHAQADPPARRRGAAPPGAARPDDGQHELGGEHGQARRPVRRQDAGRHGEQGSREQRERSAAGEQRGCAVGAAAARSPVAPQACTAVARSMTWASWVAATTAPPAGR